MKTILINEEQKEYQGHQVKSVKYHLSTKTAEVHCSVITPEGAWDYVIPDFPYEDPDNYDDFVRDFVDAHFKSFIGIASDNEEPLITRVANVGNTKKSLSFVGKILKAFRL